MIPRRTKLPKFHPSSGDKKFSFLARCKSGGLQQLLECPAHLAESPLQGGLGRAHVLRHFQRMPYWAVEAFLELDDRSSLRHPVGREHLARAPVQFVGAMNHSGNWEHSMPLEGTVGSSRSGGVRNRIACWPRSSAAAEGPGALSHPEPSPMIE
jgi:hypothetical protein